MVIDVLLHENHRYAHGMLHFRRANGPDGPQVGTRLEHRLYILHPALGHIVPVKGDARLYQPHSMGITLTKPAAAFWITAKTS